MMERLSLVLCVVLLCAAPVMAGPYSGTWYGYTSDLDNSGNWAAAGNTGHTETWNLRRASMAGSSLPVYDGTGPNPWLPVGQIEMRNGMVVTQTGGAIQATNNGDPGAALWGTLAMGHRNFNAATAALQDTDNEWNISGGYLDINGRILFGYDNYGNARQSAGTGVNLLNISGTGMLNLWDVDWEPAGLTFYDADDKITIADFGTLNVPIALKATIDSLINAGNIVGVGGSLATAETVSWNGIDQYQVSVVPEPATMALLGLGALVLRRKK